MSCVSNRILSEVVAIIQPGSKNASRIPKSELISIVECGLGDYSRLGSGVTDNDGNQNSASAVTAIGTADALIHLAWAATQGDAARGLLIPQAKNIQYALEAVELAKRCGCEVFCGVD